MKRRKFIATSALITSGIPFFSIRELVLGKVDCLTDFKKFLGSNEDDESTIIVEKGIVTIYAFELNINGNEQFLKAVTKNLVIYCYKLNLNGSLKAHEKDLKIYTNIFNCNEDSVIDLSGHSYNDEQIITANSGTTYGEDGSDGEDKYSKDGGKGGSFELWCCNYNKLPKINLSGGHGSAGQDGGNGFQGARGANGPNIERWKSDKRDYSEAKGGDGLKGGKAGNGARAGNGGDSGYFRLELIGKREKLHSDGKKFENPNIIQSTGLPGKPGKAGTRGNGGEPGVGGTISIQKGGKDFNGIIATKPGAKGKSGSYGEEGKDGKEGKKGSKWGAFVFEADYDLLGRILIQHPIWATILGNHLEYDYLKGSIANTVEQLNFINLQLKDPQTIEPFFIAFKQRNEAYAQQISIGIDFWGNCSQYGVTHNPKLLCQQVTPIILSAVEFEKEYNNFLEKTKKELAAINECNKLIQASKYKLNIKKEEKKSANYQLYELNTYINTLSYSILDLEKTLLQSEDKFRKAVEKEVGCSIEKIFSFITKVVGIAGMLHGAFTSIVDSGKDIEQVFSHRLDDDVAKNIVKKVRIVSSAKSNIEEKVSDIKSQWNNLKDEVDDKVLIGLQSSDIESLLDKFSNLPEAQQLKKDLANYVNAVDTKNKKRVELSEKFTRYLRFDSEITSLEGDLGSESLSALIKENKVASAEIIALFKRLYFNTKLDVLRMLYLERKSLEYATLERSSTIIQPDQNINFQNLEHTNIASLIIKEATKRASGPNKATSNRINFPYKNESNSILKQIKETKLYFSFTIPVTERSFNSSHKEIYATNVKVYISGILGTEETLRYNVTHFGNSKFVKPVKSKMELIEFSHEPIKLSFEWNYGKNQFKDEKYLNNNLLGQRLGNDEEYLGVSPFTTWQIIVTEITDKYKFEEVVSVGFEFEYFYRVG